MSPLYTREVLRLATAMPHLGRLAAPHASAERKAPVCGSQIIVDVALDAGGRIAALGQEVQACALGQASAALMGAHAIGRSAEELAAACAALTAYFAGSRADVGDWPGLGVLAHARGYPARHGAILLPFEAVTAAAEHAASLKRSAA